MKDGPREHYDGVAYYTLYPNAPYGTDMQRNDLVIHFTAGVAKEYIRGKRSAYL